MISDKTISVIGAGAVGGALIDLFEEKDIRLISSWRSEVGYVNGGDGMRKPVYRPYPLNNLESGSFIFIAVPDDQISVVANQLADSPICWRDMSVVHCSGTLSSDVLKPVSDKGAHIASMHPIQTFKRGDGAERFRDIFISIEGDLSLTEDLQQIVRLAGANPLIVDKEQKRALHLAAVMASNYLVALQYTANEFLANLGINNGFKLVEPLVKQTLDNISSKGVRQSLSGPIERGDLETVKKHLALLRDKPDVLQLYSQLGLKTCELAEKGVQKGSESSAQNEIKQLFYQILKKQ